MIANLVKLVCLVGYKGNLKQRYGRYGEYEFLCWGERANSDMASVYLFVICFWASVH